MSNCRFTMVPRSAAARAAAERFARVSNDIEAVELSIEELRQVAGGFGVDGTHNTNSLPAMSPSSLLGVDGTHNI